MSEAQRKEALDDVMSEAECQEAMSINPQHILGNMYGYLFFIHYRDAFP